MNTKKRTIWITKTAVFIALLIGIQAATAPFGQLITGSLVNLILVISAMTCGMASGCTVAVLSPAFAFLFAIGPNFLPIVPFIMAGNIAMVLAWSLLGKRAFANKHIVHGATAIAAAVCKFSVLYFGIVRIAIPYIFNMPEQQASIMSGLFSLPQLFTALAGGAVAAIILPVIDKALSLST